MTRTVALGVAITAGLLALGLQGGLVAGCAAVAWLLCASAPVLRPLLSRVPWPLVTLPVLGGIVAGVLFEDLGAHEALATLLAYLQTHRRLGRRGPRDDRVTVLLAGLMLVAAAGTGASVWFLPLTLLWTAALPVSLAPVPLRPVTAGWLAVVVVVLTGGVFTAVPRPGARGLGGEDIQLTGFAPEVNLGALDALLDDPGVVFRAAVSPEPAAPIYWRGIALDSFDGQRWVSTTEPVRTTVQSPHAFPADATAVHLLLEPNPDGMVFTAGNVLHVDVEGASLRRDAQGGWFYDGAGRRTVRMILTGPLGLEADPIPEDAETLDRWMTLPRSLDPRVAELAASIAGDGPPTEQLQRLADHLRDTYDYTRQPRDAGTEDPLATFLFERRSGHCEYFASALAVLARAQGIPARLVNGFVGGERSPVDGRWVVRRYHAHSWVEVHETGVGWRMVDATPGPGAPAVVPGPLQAWSEALDAWWAEAFVGYDRADQRALIWVSGRAVEQALALPLEASTQARWPWRGLAVLLGAWLLAAFVARWGVRRLARRLAGEQGVAQRGPVARQQRRAREHVRKAGWVVPRSLPPVEAARWLSDQLPPTEADIVQAIEELAWMYYEVQLGGQAPGSLAAQARVLADRVEALPNRDAAVISPP